jgi:hypothetical protein
VVTNVSEVLITTIFSVEEDGCGTFLLNFGNHLQDYRASQLRRLQSTSLEPREIQISDFESELGVSPSKISEDL